MLAKECGCDAVKLQKRDNRRLFTRALYERPYENENSFGPTYGEHREPLELDRAAYVELRALRPTTASSSWRPPSTGRAQTCSRARRDADKIASGDLTQHAPPAPRRGARQAGRSSPPAPATSTMSAALSTPSPPSAPRSVSSNARRPTLHVGRGAEPQRHHTLRGRYPTSSSAPRCTTTDRDVARRVRARRPPGREALHAEPGPERDRPRFSLMPEGMRKLVRDLRRARRRSATASSSSSRRGGATPKMGKKL